MALMESGSKMRLISPPVLVAVFMLAVVVTLAAGMPGVAMVLAIAAAVAVSITYRSPAADEVYVAPAKPLEVRPINHLADVSAGFSAIDMPLYLIDTREDLVFQNQAAVGAFGEIELNSHISARLRSPAILDCIRETIARGNVNTVEYSERHPSTRVYTVRVAPLVLDSDERYFVLSFHDISETRRLEQMRSDFVANASHELRTPLASLQGFIETLQGPAKGDAKAGERFLAIMLEQVQRMNRLVDDLLSLSRLELKAHIAPSDKVELGPLLGHVRDALQPLALSLDVEIALKLPEAKVYVTGDRDELIQVFENLVQNACKYGQDGRKVQVTLHPASDDHGPDVSVQDYGPGIHDEHLPRLTERFYRVNVEASRSKKGTGLGLAIVKHILTRHRARLLVSSEVGKGSIFTVRF